MGKPHGRWALFNGVVNDTDVIAEVRAGVTSSAAFKRHRSEKMAEELRRASEKSQKAEAYASNVLSWGLGMYNQCNGIHKFLETLATNQGVPINEIPPPPVPPPACSPSPCQSPHQSHVHILHTSQDHPALCAQDHANQSNTASQDMNLQRDGGMFGGFFSESGTGALSLSLLDNQPPTY